MPVNMEFCNTLGCRPILVRNLLGTGEEQRRLCLLLHIALITA